MVMVCSLSVSTLAMSHQMKESISVMTFNQNSGLVEIAHRIYVHDAEVVLKHISDLNRDLLTDHQAQNDFVQYIVNHFSVKFDSVPLALKLLGLEIEGQHIWIYQEYPYSVKPNFISVNYNAMMDLWPDQRHVINIEGLGSVRSMQLLSDDFSQVIDLGTVNTE